MTRRLPLIASCVLVGLLGAGCSGDDDPVTAPTPAPVTSVAASEPTSPVTAPGESSVDETVVTAPSDRIGCEVAVTGAVETTFTGKDDQNAFSSDYYLSPADLEEALGASATESAATDAADDEGAPDFTAPPRPEGSAPLIAWFLLNCQGGDVTVSFYSNPSSTKDDVPFGRRTYEITPSAVGGDVPDQFSALVAFGTRPDETWVTVEGGSIEVDRFDRRGAAGSFRVPMRERATSGELTDRELLIEGTFDVACKSGSLCEG